MSSIPKIKRFGPGARVHEQAHMIWLILVSFVMMAEKPMRTRRTKTIEYGDLAESLGYDRKAGITLSRPLGIVGEFCKANGLPALNSIVVDRHGSPGDGVVLNDGKTLAEVQRAVLETNWFTYRAPTSGTLRKVWEAME
jgi:hypothetical protein